MERIKNILENMSVVEKALCLNLLIRTKYSATTLLSVGIDKLFQSYNKETNMIIDSFVWNTLGLHYKDYIDTDLLGSGLVLVEYSGGVTTLNVHPDCCTS